MSPFEEINSVIADPAAYARRLKEETGKKVIGYLCSYTPEEIILAGGGHPFRLLGGDAAITHADAHLQAYCCSLVRGVLEEALSGRLDFLDGAVFPHTCDSIQRLSDIWRLNIPFGFHTDVVLPVKLNTESARQYMLDVLTGFRTDLERALETKISDEHLRNAIILTNNIRRSLKEIYELRSFNPSLMSGPDLHKLMKASMVMDRERFLVIATAIAAEMRGADVPVKSGVKRLVLAGGFCNHPDIYSIIEDAGGAVVWDDFCTGSRYFEELVPETEAPLEGIARRLLKRPVCPAKHGGLQVRADHLREIIRERQADGVIFVLLKFCDPHAFDYPYLKGKLDQEGIPSMLMEVETPLPPAGQIRTRIEAFMEMM
jgi:bzd-type benzoyl-CoA reductase N subunit